MNKLISNEDIINTIEEFEGGIHKNKFRKIILIVLILLIFLIIFSN
jgi:hypothetical protein